MDGLFVLLGIAAAAYLLIGPLFGFLAFGRVRAQRDEMALLRRQVSLLGQRIDQLRDALGARGEDLDRAEAPPAVAEPPREPERPAVEPAAPESATTEPPVAEAPAEAPPEPEVRDAAVAWRRLEESITSRWMVWLGGLAMALGGVFLVKHSMERGWLSPAVRVSFGFLAGVALAAAGEWLRRRPLHRALAAEGPDYVPAALTAAGIFGCFASVYAAYALYGLLAPVVAFALLAAVAFASVGLAVLQGPFIAVLGLVAGFGTPLLVSTGEHSPWALFSYLLSLSASALFIVRYMGWWWLAWAALAGAALWPLVWLTWVWSAGDALPVGFYLLAVSVLFIFVRRGAGASIELVAWPKGFTALARPEQVAWAALATVAFLTFILVRRDAYGTESLAILAALACLILAAGYREAVFDALAAVAAALTAALVATWHLPRIITRPEALLELDGQPYGGILPGPIVPPELVGFAGVSLAFAALFGIAGFVALWGARRPAVWAAVSAATPVVILTAAYWRIEGFGVDLKWSAVAVALAALTVAAAVRVERYRDARGLDLVLGIYAAGAVAALSLAATMALEQAWLTVALSLQLPALAWIHDRLSAKPLRWVALVLGAIVLARLVFNVHVLDYPLGSVPGFSWVLYGYGIPAAAFWWAARRFRATADDRVVLVLEAGTLALVTLLISFEIRSLVAGSLASSDYGLLEQGLQSSAWLGLAYGCLVQYRRHKRVVLLWGWRILAGLAAAQTILFRVLLDNPLWSGDSVGAWPILDLLFLAYAVPGILALLFARELLRAGEQRLAAFAGLSGFGLIFVYLTLEVRHLYHGPVLSLGATGDAELYTYSAVWLVYALALYSLGVRRAVASLRYVGLAILAVTVVKVFVFDTAELSNLYRFISLSVLGLALVGVTHFYKRFVTPPGSPAPPQLGETPAAPTG